MDSTKISSLLEQLDDEMDDLEESLSPLIKTALSETAAKLPLLQKAKTFTLVTYAIESILFSYLRLNGVKAREHPVFIELTRVKQYFDKIKAAEAPAKDRNLVLDKSAAARFIKAGLSGNDKYDLEKAERDAKERAKAHIKFAEVSKKALSEGNVKKPQEEPSSESGSESSSESESSAEVEKEPTPPVVPPKKKKSKEDGGKENSSENPKRLNPKARRREEKKAARKAKHEKKKVALQQKKQKKAQQY